MLKSISGEAETMDKILKKFTAMAQAIIWMKGYLEGFGYANPDLKMVDTPLKNKVEEIYNQIVSD